METIKRYGGQITPMGIEIPWLEEESPVVVVEKVKTIPKPESKAFARDLISRQREALEQPLDFLRNKMRTDLLYLLNQGLGFYDIDPAGRIPYQKEIAEMYYRLRREEIERIMILITREHFKSTFSQGYIVQEGLINPNKTFLLRAFNARSSSQFLDVIEKRVKNENMRLLFGDLEGDRWSTEMANWSTRTEYTREPNILATGIGTDVTSFHPDEGVFDDLVSESNFDTAEGRESVKRDYRAVCAVVKRKHVLNGTHWDDLDLYGDIIEKNNQLAPNNPERYEVLVMGVYGKADRELRTPEKGVPIFSYTYRNDKPEELKGVTKGAEWIQRKRFDLGPQLFSSQVLNMPISSEDQIFKEWMIKLFDIDKEWSALRKTLKFVLAIDPAGTKKEYSDYTAFVIAGFSQNFDIYIPVANQVKIDISQNHKIIDMIFDYARIWQLEKVGIEQGIYERLFKRPIKDRQRAQKFKGCDFVIRKLKWGEQPGARSNKKDDRILSMLPYMEAGVYHINKDCYELRDQLLRWRPGRTSHDDLADAMAYLLQLIPFSVKEEMQKESKTPFQRWLERKRGGKRSNNFELDFLNEEVRPSL